jgi:tRNA 5-methylaminomethyl-2-thiouridine biosynthesis bifunctional protein
MTRTPILPARIRFEDGVAYSEDFGDVYHSVAGARAQADHVFLAGNGLPQRWRGLRHFVVLETGFGLGHNFLATWDAWRHDPARSAQLWFVSLEMHPPCREDLARAHGVRAGAAPVTGPADSGAHVHADAGLPGALVAAWPPLTPDVHHLTFASGQVHLLLSLGDAGDGLRQLVAQVDAFYLDGFAPAKNAALWDARVFKSCARLAAPGATAATWSVAAAVQQGLRRVGFEVHQAPGLPPKRAMTVARFAPRVAPPLAVGRRPASAPSAQTPTPTRTHTRPNTRTDTCMPKGAAPWRASRADAQAAAQADALVIGAGLAGASVARALADQGWRVCVLDKHAQPAQETSGNPAGLFHGVVHGNDGAHARLLRAASLRAAQVLRPLLAAGRVIGEIDGLLRMVTADGADEADAWAGVIARQGLPPDYACVLDARAASQAAGLTLRHAACLYPGGGWLSPPSLVTHWLDSPLIQVLCNAEVASLVPGARVLPEADADRRLGTSPAVAGPDTPATPMHPGPAWQACDTAGRVLAQAPVVVLANAADAERLIDQASRCGPVASGSTSDEAAAPSAAASPDTPAAPARWPISLVRGQVTLVPAAVAGSLRPRLPLASRGYVIGLPDALGGGVLCGATSDLADGERTVRDADHAANLAQAERLTGQRALPAAGALTGRVGWRCVADDRLPVVGPVPDQARSRQLKLGQEQPRHVPRIAGLYVYTALGSRGITWAPLLGEALASWITGAPMPLEAGLIDAIDAARFVSRQVRSANPNAAANSGASESAPVIAPPEWRT